MNNIFNSLSAVLLIIIMGAVGFLFGKQGWMKASHKGFLIKFLINAAVPCLCVNNVFSSVSREMLQSAGKLLLVPLLSMLLMFALAFLLAKLLRISKRRLGGFIVMCALSNSMFVGYPMCKILFGEVGVPFVMFFYMVNTILFWTLGNYLIHRSGSQGDHNYSVGASFKSLLTPPLLSLVAAIALLLVGFEPPELLIALTDYMGGTVTPLALVYIGFILHETGLRQLRPDRGMIAVMGMRFLVGPLLMLGLCALTGISGVDRGVFTIQAAMPVMTQSVIVSAYAGADEEYNARGMSLTTLACVVVVPALMLIV